MQQEAWLTLIAPTTLKTSMNHQMSFSKHQTSLTEELTVTKVYNMQHNCNILVYTGTAHDQHQVAGNNLDVAEIDMSLYGSSCFNLT